MDFKLCASHRRRSSKGSGVFRSTSNEDKERKCVCVCGKAGRIEVGTREKGSEWVWEREREPEEGEVKRGEESVSREGWTGVGGYWMVWERSAQRRSRSRGMVCRGRYRQQRRNAGIGEAVTMTTVTGEVLVRIRDHAYVTMPWRHSVDGNGGCYRRETWRATLIGPTLEERESRPPVATSLHGG